MPIPVVCRICDGVGLLLNWKNFPNFLFTCRECEGRGWARSAQILMVPPREQPAQAGEGSAEPSSKPDEWVEA